MPEARDPIWMPTDRVAEVYSRRRTLTGRLGIVFRDDDTEMIINRTPFRWGATPLTGGSSGQTMGMSPVTRGGGAGRGIFGTPRTVYRRGSRSQNSPPSGSSFRRGRGGRSGSQSVLPSWYPRTPLGDITHVVRAFERRRTRFGDGDGQIFGSPTPIRINQQPAGHESSPSGAQLEHSVSFVTPKPTLSLKSRKPLTLGNIPKILADIANQSVGESEFLTPQKKLLNSIDIAEKVVMEELKRLKRTPTAKKAERERRVRTLMSMR